ncbi:MAG TPA: WXG100 family type VII secretion target, partial [Mycobacteriales bacterium]|nr:WXG100 family type VII secretion target [Mycobacteriales bacterium]
MRTALDPDGVTTAQTFVVPKVEGDPAAARRLASTYREAADDVDAASRQASFAVEQLTSSWRGSGQVASEHPLSTLQRNASVTVRALRDSADALDAYAHKLETAHHHHWFSLHKLLAVAAVVTVTATAVVVTMGAAAVAEAALAAGAASEATAAAGAAAAAGSGAASALADSTLGLTGVRALLSFAVPHLVQAELSAGFAAGLEESGDGHLDWREIGVSFGAG